MWATVQTGAHEAHVVPVDDMYYHILWDRCRCEPVIEPSGMGIVVVHNSFDGRETVMVDGSQTTSSYENQGPAKGAPGY